MARVWAQQINALTMITTYTEEKTMRAKCYLAIIKSSCK